MGVPTCNFDSMSCYNFHHCRVYRGSYPTFYYRMTYARTLITLELLPHGALKTCTGFVGSDNYVAYGRVFLRNRTRYLSTSRDWLLCCRIPRLTWPRISQRAADAEQLLTTRGWVAINMWHRQAGKRKPSLIITNFNNSLNILMSLFLCF